MSAADVPGGPDLRMLLREARAPLEIARFFWSAHRLTELPRGDGHPVLLVPGFGVGDDALRPLSRTLERLGYAVSGWGEGRNLGMRPPIRGRLSRRVADLARQHRSTVSLIGWSLGGVFVRELARARPTLVRRVITIGSPINGYPLAEDLLAQLRMAIKGALFTPDPAALSKRSRPPPVPCTAIYSKTDGFVAWRAAMEMPAPNTENIEVRGSHIGLAFNLEVLRVIARCLARDTAA